MRYIVNVPIVLDASATLVLFASGHLRDVVRSLPVPVFVVQETIDECRYLRSVEAAGRLSKTEEIRWPTVLSDSTLRVLERTHAQEFADFVRFAAAVDEGEAAAAAAALHRGYSLAIDDLKARRVFATELHLIWSLDLLRHWCDSAKIDAQEISAILGDIRRKATYLPHRAHPALSWWQQYFTPE
jgi:predicted nucleic acid-binding protein